MENKNFGVEIIAKGEFIDDLGERGGKWKIETATMRLSPDLHSAWYPHFTAEGLFNERNIKPEELDKKQYDALEKEADELNKQYKKKIKAIIANLTGLEGANNVVQVVSEIFTIVRMTCIVRMTKI